MVFPLSEKGHWSSDGIWTGQGVNGDTQDARDIILNPHPPLEPTAATCATSPTQGWDSRAT